MGQNSLSIDNVMVMIAWQVRRCVLMDEESIGKFQQLMGKHNE